MEAYQPPPQFVNQAPVWHGQPRPSPPRPVVTSPPPPIIRLQNADEPKRQAPREPAPLRLQLPSPEQLGVSTTTAKTDTGWSRVDERLEQLGAVCFHVDKLPTGNYRVSCLLPTSEPDRARHIEVESNSKTEAVRLALDKAEECSVRNNSKP